MNKINFRFKAETRELSEIGGYYRHLTGMGKLTHTLRHGSMTYTLFLDRESDGRVILSCHSSILRTHLETAPFKHTGKATVKLDVVSVKGNPLSDDDGPHYAGEKEFSIKELLEGLVLDLPSNDRWQCLIKARAFEMRNILKGAD